VHKPQRRENIKR